MEEQSQKGIKIGKLKLYSKVSLAPMAGITDMVLRQLVRKFSKNALLTTEMISSEALVQRPTGTILKYEEFEKPLVFQISGHKPHLMAKAAKILEPMASVIDINMGCPVNKVVKGTDGCALMKNPELAADIIKAVKDAVDIPVTCKFRLGWSLDELNFVEFAKKMEESGADFITIHARTRKQLYSGNADWAKVKELKGEIEIPYFVNGDVNSVEKAKNALELSGAEGVAVARGVMGDPWLINRIDHYFNTGEILPEPTLKDKIELLKEHIIKEIELRREDVAIKFVRKFYPYYIKGIRGGSEFRAKLVTETSLDKIMETLDRIAEIG